MTRPPDPAPGREPLPGPNRAAPRGARRSRESWALVRAPGGGSGFGAAETMGGAWWRFDDPVEILRAARPEEVPTLLDRVDRASRDGLWAVGFVGYEASPAFDPAFRTHPPEPGVPVAWFGLFRTPSAVAPEALEAAAAPVVSALTPTVSEGEYLAAVGRVREHIARGETYQANLTYRLRGRLASPGSPDRAPEVLFRRLATAQAAPYATYLEMGGEHAVCSASPELFFERSGHDLLCRPMKGTAGRGSTARADREAAAGLLASAKERAENVMIVDMIRNDLGRIARPGTVRVDRLFRVERYPTVFQMTSDVSARSDASLVELFGALFPCASITGAPKVRTMEILRSLETTPRGVYTGAVGFVAPGGNCRFSVAIRTARAFPDTGSAGGERLEYGTGSGVVWDSDPRAELEETRTKARILSEWAEREAWPPADARLLETLLWVPPEGPGEAWGAGPEGLWGPDGFLLLEEHLGRLARSARELGFAVDVVRVRKHLEELGQELAGEPERCPRRVRLLVARDGTPLTEERPGGAASRPERPWRLALATDPVDAGDRRLAHKTTDRRLYERARAAHPGADDVILWNREGELTESTLANLVLEMDGQLLTPAAECGLLPGTYRAFLLERGVLREARLAVEDLVRADRIALINSVRGWIPAELRSRPGSEPIRRAAAARLGEPIDSTLPTR